MTSRNESLSAMTSRQWRALRSYWSRVCLKRVLIGLLLIACGIIAGITVNYYGLVFEAIHVEIKVSPAQASNTSSVLHSLSRDLLPGRHGNSSSPFVVPNIVHFIWFATDVVREVSFLNYISIKSAYQIQRPDAILFHCNQMPSGLWWQRLWTEVPLTIVYRQPPQHIHNQRLYHIYHSGDVAKMEILLEYGGIYLDYDVIVVNNMDPLRKYDATLGKEKPPKFIAGIIVARQGATFLRLLYESYRNNYRPWDWDYNCARVAYQLYTQRPDLLHVEDYKLTTPDWKERWKLWDAVIDWSDLYVIHVMGHFMWFDYSPDSIKTINSTFGEAMRFIYYGNKQLIA